MGMLTFEQVFEHVLAHPFATSLDWEKTLKCRHSRILTRSIIFCKGILHFTYLLLCLRWPAKFTCDTNPFAAYMYSSGQCAVVDASVLSTLGKPTHHLFLLFSFSFSILGLDCLNWKSNGCEKWKPHTVSLLDSVQLVSVLEFSPLISWAIGMNWRQNPLVGRVCCCYAHWFE